jgi:hypothetical protein
LAAILACGCSGDGDETDQAGTARSSTTAPVERVIVRGHATLDGAPFDADFLGAVVRKDGFFTACQGSLPRVERGLYVIEVMSSSVASGCGTPGSDILLWTFTRNTEYFSTEAVSWPADARTRTFDVPFETAKPNGLAPPRTEFAGEIYEQDGTQLPEGTNVEAFIGKTLCGVASVRTSGDFTGFILTVVGPESIAGCARDATVTFRVDGRQAITTAVNNFQSNPSFDLMLPAS